jgi:hypothetical protein
MSKKKHLRSAAALARRAARPQARRIAKSKHATVASSISIQIGRRRSMNIPVCNG